MVSYNREHQRYPTSKRNDFRITMKKNERAKNYLFDKGLRKFNELPEVIKNEKNKVVFKRKLKENLVI